jgi:hypothetical protein
MDDKRTPKRILEWKPIGTRIRGRQRKRWIADIEEDMQKMGIRRWRNQYKERAEWKRITGKAKILSQRRSYIRKTCSFIFMYLLRARY